MLQLALPLGPPNGRNPSFLAEDNETLLGIAAQDRRRIGGRLQAIAVLRWRETLPKRGARARPTRAQLDRMAEIELELARLAEAS